ncbi:MAG: hypothetical protein QW165_04245 [Candidatus Woesearchaeota archaeon]
MSQEAITEIDMDVFSRRIGPYFTWLESRIESGWQQSDSVQKDVLKEVKYLATTMRARFILGVSKDDFTKEVQRAVDLFELAAEAFPGESDEIEAKLKHFAKGVQEELGAQFLPSEYRTEGPRPPKPPEPHPFPMPEPEPVPEPDKPEEPEEEKISKLEPAKQKADTKKTVAEPPKEEIKKIDTQKTEIKKQKPEANVTKAKKSGAQKTTRAKETAKTPKQKTAEKPRKTRKNFLVRWLKGFIWGPED